MELVLVPIEKKRRESHPYYLDSVEPCVAAHGHIYLSVYDIFPLNILKSFSFVSSYVLVIIVDLDILPSPILLFLWVPRWHTNSYDAILFQEKELLRKKQQEIEEAECARRSKVVVTFDLVGRKVVF